MPLQKLTREELAQGRLVMQCRRCRGRKTCTACSGLGEACAHCRFTGRCPRCWGTGVEPPTRSSNEEP